MKKLITLLALLFVAATAWAQVHASDTTAIQTAEDVFCIYEPNQLKPTFNGEDANSFAKWVKTHQRYPRKAKKAGIGGRVILTFKINEKGKLTDIQIRRGVHPLLDKEAVRVVKSAPQKWTAGTQNGKPITVTYIFPVIFSLSE